MDWISVTINLTGGLALFLYGMTVMTDSLKEAAKGKMKPFLSRMVSNRWKALLAGTGITALIQSSSVTTVLAVGFVSAGILQFEQTIGIILGSGIGTTITAQIVAFKVTKASLVFIALGFFLSAIFTKRTYRQMGNFLLGLGLIFLGMNLMSEGTEPLKYYPPFIDAMKNLDNPLWGVLLGALFTAVVQSSSATTGVVIMLSANGLLTIEPSISLIIGANIGTCVTAILSALGKPRASMQVAMAHVLFKTIGAIIWIVFIPQLAMFVKSITPGDIARQVANAHTTFNVANALVMIWFTVPFSKLVKFIVPDKKTAKQSLIPNLDQYYLMHSGVALDLSFEALKKLGAKVSQMIHSGIDTALNGNEHKIKLLQESDNEIDAGYSEIIIFVQKIQQNNLIPQEVNRLNNLTETANIFENIADLITTNLVEAAEHRLTHQISIDPKTKEDIKAIYTISAKAFDLALYEFSENRKTINWENEKVIFKGKITELRNKQIAQLSKNNLNQIDSYKFETEIIEVSRHLHGLARRLARKIG